MSFKIRNTDTETNEEYEACQAAYIKHLASFKKSSNSDLWKFFTWDFFHDGTINSIKFHPDLRTVAIHLNCPNIRSNEDDGKFNYVNAGFICTFKNVVHFSLKDSAPTEWRAQSGGPSTFLSSEINTAIPDNLSSGSEDFYSLIIETLGTDAQLWIELVFSQVNVVPKEPAAFAIMEKDNRFHVPTYRADA